MSTNTTQLKCPFCGAANPLSDIDQIVCEFCLQPFTVTNAKSEESRLLEEIKAWLNTRVGGAGVAGSTDATSRSFIFKDKLLPELKRLVDRGLESLGGYGQHPLMQPPLPTPQREAHPLLVERDHILGLKGLRAKLESPYIREFAVLEEDQKLLQRLDRRVLDLMHLSNVAHAAGQLNATGYASARNNLVTLAREAGESAAFENKDPKQVRFLGALQTRYDSAAQLCRVFEELCSPNPTSGQEKAERLERIIRELEGSARAIEESDYDPGESMPIVLGIKQEVEGARLFVRWLRAYEALTARRPMPFMNFVHNLHALLVSSVSSKQEQIELLEACSFVVQVTHGAATTPVAADFGWVDSWVETARGKGCLGMFDILGLFGPLEELKGTERFLNPVWLARVNFSQAQGKVFKEGVETSNLLIVDAVSPSIEKVKMVSALPGGVGQQLQSPARLESLDIALPRSTANRAVQVFTAYVRNQGDIRNPKVELQGLGFVAAVVAHFSSKQGDRSAYGCLSGALDIDANARTQVQATRQLLQTLGG